MAIREFRSPAYLRQGAIVYKPSPEQIGFYAYHRWAISPCEFVTNSVIEWLRASGDFARVKPYDGRSDTEFVLSGRLEKLEEIDYAGGVKVEVAISAQMTNLATGLSSLVVTADRAWARSETTRHRTRRRTRSQATGLPRSSNV